MNDIGFVITVHIGDTLIAVKDLKRVFIQHKDRIRYIVKNRVILLFRLFQFFFELFPVGNVENHLDHSNNLAPVIFNGGRVHQPMSHRSVFVKPGLLAPMGFAVVKGVFNRTDQAFLRSPLVGPIAVITGLGREFFFKFPVVFDQPVVFILYGDNTRHQFKQYLILIPLPVQLHLFFADLLSHLIDGCGKLTHFITRVCIQFRCIFTLSNQAGVGDQFFDRSVHKPDNEKKNDRHCRREK